jgi:hypothetical protein
MKEATPQALLRDLFRPAPPELHFQERELLWRHDWSGTSALQEVRDARKLEALPRIQPLIHEVTRIAAAWQKVVSDRWQPILDDSEPRKRVYTSRDPSINW